MRISSLVFLTTLLLGLTGCVSNPAPKQTEAVIPNWYKMPPANSSENLYGIGAGFTQSEAIDSALADLTQRLSSKVQSITSNKLKSTREYREYTEEVLSQSVSISSAELDLSDYKVEQHSLLPDDSYSYLISLPTVTLYEKLNEERNSLLSRKSSIDSELLTLLERWWKQRDLIKDFEEFASKEAVLKILAEKQLMQSSSNLFAENWTLLLKNQKRLSENIKVRIISNDLNLSNVLQAQLSDAGFKVDPDNAKITIEIKSDPVISESHGIVIAKSLVALTLYEQGQLIYSETHSIKGASSNNKADAITKLADAFKSINLLKLH